MSNDQLPPGYEKYKSEDPFSDIPPALLNSADIADYVRAVRMVVPFETSKLKPASYEVPFSGEVFWWDAETNEKRRQKIKSKDDTFILKSNAIVYVCPDTTFYLPDYIAMRFGLRITHVHQGLLLGTGPLVDPGFCGRLLIPLHNMTSNEYSLVCGNGLIWVEFTKLNAWSALRKSEPPLPREGAYVPFRKDKTFLVPDFYFQQAVGERQIVSSIPTAMAESREDAARAASDAKTAKDDAGVAARNAETARRKLDFNLGIGLIALFVSTVAIILTALQVSQNTLDSKTKASEEVVKVQIDGFQKELNRIREDLDKMGKTSAQRKDVPKLEQRK